MESRRFTNYSNRSSGTAHTARTALQNMRINFSGLDILMTELLLHGADVRARLQQVRGEGMPQGVAGYLFLDAGDPGRILYKLVLPTCLPRVIF